MVDRRKLDAALRRNRGRLIRDEWLRELAAACGLPVHLIELIAVDETAKMKCEFVAKLVDRQRNARPIFWDAAEDAGAFAFVAAIGERNNGVNVVLFSSVDDQIGACLIDAKRVLQNAKSVWNVVKNDLCIATTGIADGLCLEKNYSPATHDRVIELCAWGSFAEQGK